MTEACEKHANQIWGVDYQVAESKYLCLAHSCLGDAYGKQGFIVLTQIPGRSFFQRARSSLDLAHKEEADFPWNNREEGISSLQEKGMVKSVYPTC